MIYVLIKSEPNANNVCNDLYEDLLSHLTCRTRFNQSPDDFVFVTSLRQVAFA